MLSTKPNNLVYLKRDRGYRWQDRDPVMEALCDIIDKSGLSIGDIIKRVYEDTNHHVNIHYKTIENWLSGKTKRPHNVTMDAVAHALGYTRGDWKRIKKSRGQIH